MENLQSYIILSVAIGLVNYISMAVYYKSGDNNTPKTKLIGVIPILSTFIVFLLFNESITFISSSSIILEKSDVEEIKMCLDDINYHIDEIQVALDDYEYDKSPLYDYEETMAIPYDEDYSSELIYYFTDAKSEMSQQELKESFNYISSFITEYVGEDSAYAIPYTYEVVNSAIDFNKIEKSETKINELCNSIITILKDQP